jgi:DnaJ-class molecular chaperone
MPLPDIERLRKVRARIPRMDYFQILNVSTEATDVEVKKAFRKRSMSFHPDRYYSADEETKEIINMIYKAVSQAYNSLRSARHRQIYLKLITEDRAANLKINPARVKQDATGEIAQEKQTGPGAKYYDMAMQAFASKDYRSAKNQIKLALTMESQNPVFLRFQEKLESL